MWWPDALAFLPWNDIFLMPSEYYLAKAVRLRVPALLC